MLKLTPRLYEGVMVSSVNNTNAVDIKPIFDKFAKQIKDGSFQKEYIGGGIAAVIGEEDFIELARSKLLYYSSENSLTDKIIEKASVEDLTNLLYSGKKGLFSMPKAAEELIRKLGLGNEPEVQNFLSGLTEKIFKMFEDELAFEQNSLNKLLEEDNGIQSLFDMVKKYNQNLKSNLALRYEM